MYPNAENNAERLPGRVEILARRIELVPDKIRALPAMARIENLSNRLEQLDALVGLLHRYCEADDRDTNRRHPNPRSDTVPP